MVLQKVISKIRWEIPVEVLEVAFLGGIGREKLRPGNMDWEIRNKIIDARVRQDCDVLGAQELNIPLQRAEVIYDPTGLYQMVVRIPKALTQGRTIVEALYFNYVYNYGAAALNGGYLNNAYSANSCGNSTLMNYASKILNSSTGTGPQGTAAVRVIGENTIAINDYNGSVNQGSMTCRVAHDDEMSSIPPRAIPQFSQLCVYATKAWIYKTLRVKLNGGYLSGGTELGELQAVVSEYAESAQLYDEYLREEWTAVSMLNDPSRSSWYHRNLIGGEV